MAKRAKANKRFKKKWIKADRQPKKIGKRFVAHATFVWLTGPKKDKRSSQLISLPTRFSLQIAGGRLWIRPQSGKRYEWGKKREMMKREALERKRKGQKSRTREIPEAAKTMAQRLAETSASVEKSRVAARDRELVVPRDVADRQALHSLLRAQKYVVRYSWARLTTNMRLPVSQMSDRQLAQHVYDFRIGAVKFEKMWKENALSDSAYKLVRAREQAAKDEFSQRVKAARGSPEVQTIGVV